MVLRNNQRSEDENILKGRVLLWWREQHPEQEGTLESILNSIPPPATEVEQLLLLQREFQDVRNILAYYQTKGLRPSDEAFSVARRFDEQLRAKEARFESYLQESFAAYQALLSEPSLTPAVFTLVKEQFVQARSFAERYDPSRREELEELAKRVEEGVAQRFLEQGVQSSFATPKDDAYQELKRSYVQLHRLLNTRAYQPGRKGARERLSKLIEELHPIAIKAKGYDFAPEVNDTLIKAYELERECMTDEHRVFWRRALFALAGLSALVVGSVGIYRIDRLSEVAERLTKVNDGIVQHYTADELKTLKEGTSELALLEKKLRLLEERVGTFSKKQPGELQSHQASVLESDGVRTPRTVVSVMHEKHPLWALYVSVNKHQGSLYDLSGEVPRLLYTAPCTLGAVPGNKERIGDHRTQQGVFRVENAAIGHFEPLYGDAFMNLADNPFPGLQVTGTGIPERLRAIAQGYNSTNGAVTFRNKDARSITSYVLQHGIKDGVVIIEDSRRPLR